jgi:hypothetical protein
VTNVKYSDYGVVAFTDRLNNCEQDAEDFPPASVKYLSDFAVETVAFRSERMASWKLSEGSGSSEQTVKPLAGSFRRKLRNSKISCVCFSLRNIRNLD